MAMTSIPMTCQEPGRFPLFSYEDKQLQDEQLEIKLPEKPKQG